VAQHNVFISHRHEDDHLLEDLKQVLSRHGADVRDSSVNSSNPNNASNEEYIKSLLRDRIEWAGKIIIIISPETHNHDWVDWEVEYAKKFPDKRIIAVYAPGTVAEDIPKSLEEYADSILNWDGDAIVAALEKDVWRAPDGTPAAPHDIPRAPC
jgi:hypothetical protein